MSPIDHIPFELLSKIFESCAEDYPPCNCLWTPIDGLSHYISLANLPFTLAGVCRHWKDVAWDTPSLWHRLFVGPGRGRSMANLLNYIERRVHRAKNDPLLLYVVDDFGSANDLHSTFSSFITRHLNRWYHIQLYTTKGEVFSDEGLWRTLAQSKFPHLERLAFGGDTIRSWPTNKPLKLSPENYPRLTALALGMMYTSSVQGVWEQLSIIDLHHVYLSELVQALNLVRRLVHLRVTDLIEGDDDDPVSFSADPLPLPFLETLDVACNSPEMQLPLLFAHIQAQRLRRLRCVTSNDAICPWSEGEAKEEALTVLLPFPQEVSPDIIIAVDTSSALEDGIDFDFVQDLVPRSHLLHVHSLEPDVYRMQATNGFPSLWGDWGRLCHLCFTHEGEATEYDCPSTTRFRVPLLDHDLETCGICQRREAQRQALELSHM